MCQKSQNATHKLLSMIPYPPKRSLKVATFFFFSCHIWLSNFFTLHWWEDTLSWLSVWLLFGLKKLNFQSNQNFLKYHIYFRNWLQRSLLHHVKFWLAFERLQPSTLLQVKCWPKVIYTSTQMYTHTHVIMKYVCTPTNPVNPHDLLGGIVIIMVLYGMQNAAWDKFNFEQICANCAH